MGRKIKYYEIADGIKKYISEHKLSGGDQLPTETELMDLFHVSRQTIRLGVTLLEKEGLVIKRQGAGTFLSPEITDQIIKHRRIGFLCQQWMMQDMPLVMPLIHEGAESVCNSKGYEMVTKLTGNGVEQERAALLFFLEHGVDGLLLSGVETAFPMVNDDLLERFRSAHIPVVFFHETYRDDPTCISVKMDYTVAANDAVHQLINLGHTRIGTVLPADELSGFDLYSGYIHALREQSIPVLSRHSVWYTKEFWNVKNFAESLRITECLKDCTAVICANDIIAIRTITAMQKAGIRVPEDISVIGFDNSTDNTLSFLRLTTYEHAGSQMGELAAGKLLNMIEGGLEASIKLPMKRVNGNSTTRTGQADSIKKVSLLSQ